MRPILIVTAAAVAVLAAGAAAHAQESFFNKRYCVIAGGNASGSGPDCSYNTLEQCRASVTGTKYCAENPYRKSDAPTAKRRTPVRG